MGLTVLNQTPDLQQLLNSLYDCDYKGFFKALVNVNDLLLGNRFLSQHTQYMVRELRVLIYAQYLEAYRSVTLQSMSASFGVSMDFLDTELSRFISAGRLNAKIDKPAGVVETNRPDKQNAQYQ